LVAENAVLKGSELDAEADALLARVQQLLQEDANVLEAATQLSTMLSRVEPAAETEASRISNKVRDSQVFKEVLLRMRQYHSVMEIVPQSTDFKLMWEKENSILWLHHSQDATWFEYKVASYFDMQLRDLGCALHEMDLQAKFQPMIVGAPRYLGPHNRHLMIVQSLVSALVTRIELIVEVMRFVNLDVGFWAERIRSDFPKEGVPIPPEHWRNKRIAADTRQLMIPCGGGKQGTIVTNVTRVDVGFRIPSFLLKFFCDRLSQDYLDNLAKIARLFQQPDHPWKARLAADVDHFYEELSRAEEAAAKREAFSLKQPPGPEIFAGPWSSGSSPFKP